MWWLVVLLRLAARALELYWLPAFVVACSTLVTIPGPAQRLRDRVGHMTQAASRYRDFTPSQDPITFRVGGDVFEVKTDIPLGLLAELADLAGGAEQITPRQQLERIGEFFDAVLLPTSAERMRARTAKDAEEPIGASTVISVMQWLIEAFTVIPTQQPSDSAGSSPDGGQSSTAGASPTE